MTPAKCPASEFNFASTLFAPKVEAKITSASGTITAESEDNIYPIPAIGISVPMGDRAPDWRFGLAAHGVSSLGVDYKDTTLDNSTFYDF